MRLTESEKTNPQDYNVEVGIDGEGNPIYKPNQDVSADYAPAKAFRKRVFDGNADIVILANKIQIYWKSNLIAEAELEGQVETSPGVWQGQLFSFADANIKKIDWRTDVPTWDLGIGFIVREVCLYEEVNYECLISNNDIEPGVDVEWELYWKQLDPIEKPFYRANEVKTILGIPNCVIGMDVHHAFKDTKLSFYIDVPGENTRLRWQCRVKDSAIYVPPVLGGKGSVITPAQKGLQFSVQDYEGEVNASGKQSDPESGWSRYWWTFEPNGKQIDVADARTPLERYQQGVGLEIDPYLSVDEQASWIYVYCDGYVVRYNMHGDYDGNTFIEIDTSGTERATLFTYIDETSNNYSMGYDSNRISEVIENTPNRVVIRSKGNYDRTTGVTNNYLANSDSFEIISYIYLDRIFNIFKHVVSGNITIASDAGYGSGYATVENVTNENSIVESGDSEISASLSTYYDSADYIGWTSDEIDCISIALYEENFNMRQYSWNADGKVFFLQEDNLSAGTYIFVNVVIFDSPSREGSAKIYDSTDRLAMGNQYKDAILDQSPSKGDDVTDMIFPARISSGTLHADGAHHYEPDGNDELKLTLDIVRLRPSIVIHDWPFQYGSVESPTSILLNHLKMDDNTSNNDLLAEVGPNGTWYTVIGGAARNTSLDSVAADNFRGRALDTQDGTGFGKLAVGAGTPHDNDFLKKGSILIKFTPQFNWNDGTHQVIFDLWQGSNDYVNCFYNETNDEFVCEAKWGGTSVYVDTAAFTENYSLQKQKVILFSWDSEKDFISLAVDGQTVETGINTSTPTTSHPSIFYIGLNNGGGWAADVIYDEIKTFSEFLQPGGAFFIGNGPGLLADIDTPHADPCFFWDAQGLPAKGGTDLATSKTGVLGSGNTGGITSFPVSGGIVGGYFDNETGAANYYCNFPVVSADIISGDKGCIAIYCTYETLAAWDTLFGYGDADDHIVIEMNASSQLYAKIYLEATSTMSMTNDLVTLVAAKWYWVVCRWDITKDRLDLSISGVNKIGAVSTSYVWSYGSGGDIYFGSLYNGNQGADVFIGRAFISKNPDTPEIWTAFGKPLHLPLIDKQ